MNATSKQTTHRHFLRRMLFVLCAAWMLLSSTAFAGDLRQVGRQPIAPQLYQSLLGRGMDVDWCKTDQGMAAYNSKAVADFKAAGVSHVRIRVKEDADEALLDLLERQVGDCLAAGVIPVIAYQADALKNDPSDKNLRQVENWWRRVAERFRDASYLLSFDLIIEVTDQLNKQPERLNEIYETLVSAVRETNPQRILIISPRCRSDASYLKDLAVPSQANGYLMAEWHFYAAGPSKTNARKLWTTGTAEERRLVTDKVALALAWQAETGIPTWVGAWMAGNYNDGNEYTVPEQMTFAAFLAETLADAGIPFAVNADTHFYDREKNRWIDEMQPLFQTIFGAAPAFSDIPSGAWYHDAVQEVAAAGLMGGTSSTTFAPLAHMTRQQMWMVLARMSGAAPENMSEARAWAVKNGVSDGSAPGAPVTRQQFVTLLWRSAGSPDASADLSGYTDFPSVAGYARTAMRWGVAQGVVSGTSAHTLSPGSTANRMQIAVMLSRYTQ